MKQQMLYFIFYFFVGSTSIYTSLHADIFTHNPSLEELRTDAYNIQEQLFQQAERNKEYLKQLNAIIIRLFKKQETRTFTALVNHLKRFSKLGDASSQHPFDEQLYTHIHTLLQQRKHLVTDIVRTQHEIELIDQTFLNMKPRERNQYEKKNSKKSLHLLKVFFFMTLGHGGKKMQIQ